MKILKNILIIIGIIIIIGALGYLGYGYYKKLTEEVKNPIATMEVENFGTIKIKLYPDMAPNTVANFICLANRGFYNGKVFHRTIPDFMIQGGDKNGDGTGSPTLNDIKDNGGSEEYNIKGEFIANGFNQNTLKHEKGVISMARADYSSLSSTLTTKGYNSGGSQFFIMTEDNESLDGLYAAFGKVIEGMDIVEQIENVEVVTRDQNAEEGVDKPVNPPVIKSLTVDTFGVDYGVPETVEPFDYNSWITENYGSAMPVE
mgnify:FL=1